MENKKKKVSVEIDDDAIIPILPDDSPFADNLQNRIKDYIRIIFGDDILTQNLNYIEQALSKGINDYLQKDFYTDHKKYSNNSDFKAISMSIDELEKKLGIDFFVNLEGKIGKEAAASIEATDPSTVSIFNLK